MDLPKKKSLYALFVLLMVLFCFYLNKAYGNELNRVINEMIPSLPNRNFTFFSGDKNVTDNINFPTAISLELKPGDTFYGTFIAKNHESDTKTFNLLVDPFSKMPAQPELKFLHNQNFNLQKEAVEIIKYAIGIPENLKEGRYKTVASLILEKSSADKDENDSMKLRPAIGISIKINVSGKPNYRQYSPLITKEPYEIAGKRMIAEVIRMVSVLLAISSLFFLLRHFRH